MDRRLELHQKLVNILGSNNVYFQPPATIKLQYPCIIYHRSRIKKRHADNIMYNHTISYSLLLIGRSPESNLVEKILELPYCSYDRWFASDDLNHDAFTIYY
jgi:hypothetical protein